MKNGSWKLLLTCGIILSAVAIAYATLKQKVEYNSASAIEHNKRLTIVEKAVIEQRLDIIYIKESLIRIEEKLP